MREVKKVAVDANDAGQLEVLHYEVFARKEMVAYMIKTGMNESEGFKTYEKNLTEMIRQYEKQKEDITRKYVPEEYMSEQYMWNINFDNRELIVMEK